MREIILKDNDRITYIWMTERYGRAEFCMCPIFKRGKLKEIYIYPKQQPDKNDIYYKVELNNSSLSFEFNSMTNENPGIWRNFWCKEHNCLSFRVYVPSNTSYLYVERLTDLSFIFG